MRIKLNPLVDKYLTDGCMRCKYGATAKCKVNKWREELETIRQIVLESGLKEEIKWGVPVYTYEGKNVVAVAALKDSATIGFFKGVLLKDASNILMQQGNMQSDRIIKFTHTNEILAKQSILKEYIHEAIEIEMEGRKVEFKKIPEELPEELINIFHHDATFKNAFYALTPGRQRGYIIYFKQAKHSETRLKRIEKYKQQIFKGVGLNDR